VRRFGGRVTLFLLTLLAGGACAPGAGEAGIDRLDVSVVVGRDGSVRVDESLVVRIGDTPVSTFHRFVPEQPHDGLRDIGAFIDDVATPPGAGPGTIDVAPERGIDVRWTFPPVSNTTRTFRLTYLAGDAVHVSGIRGRLSWRILSAGRGMDAGAVRISVTLPDEAVLLGDPWVEEAGWEVARRANGMTASAPAVTRGRAATAGIEFTIDTATMRTPRWQYELERAEEFAPAFLSAAIFVVVVGLGILAMIRLKYSRKSPGSVGERQAVGRDLRRSAWAVLTLGAAGWATVHLTLASFGIWPSLVPMAVMFVGVLFLWGGARWSRS
jgi:hypothetical protein